MIRGGLRRRSPLPPGAVTVAVGLGVAGVCTYGFLGIAGHALGAAQYSAFAGFWALLFVVAPGVFMPLEQELARAMADRRARGDGGGPIVIRCALIGGGFLVLLLAACGALFGPIDARVLGGDAALMLALMLGLAAYCTQHLTRGALSGSARFRSYGAILGGEGLYRVVFCAVLALAHVRSPGPYALAVVAGSLAAVITVVVWHVNSPRPGSPVRNAEVTTALASLLVASVATQVLFNGGTVVVRLLARPDENTAAGTFLNGRVLAFVPLFLFQAVTAALLPRLSTLHGTGQFDEFRRTLGRLLGFVLALGAASVIGALVVGPRLLRLVFGPSYVLSGRDLALLALACTTLMVAQSLAQALIAGSRYRAVVFGWLCGVAGFLGTVALTRPLLLRVELALVAGGLVAAGVMALLQPGLRHRRASEVRPTASSS